MNWVKWSAVVLLAALTLLAIVFVHSGNRVTAALAMGVTSQPPSPWRS